MERCNLYHTFFEINNHIFNTSNNRLKLEYFFFHQLDAMKKDSLGTSHPINTEVHNPAEIGSLFDAISYEKVKKKQ